MTPPGGGLQPALLGVCITDIEGTIQFVNPAFETLSGYRREELIGQNPRVLQSGVHGEEFYRVMWETLSDGREWSGSIVDRRKDGRLFEVDTVITPVVNSAGSTTHYVAVQRDVTGLRQAQKLETLGELVAGIAHEINNPASFVRVNLAVLAELWEDARPILDERLIDEPDRLIARLPWEVCKEELPKLMDGMRTGMARIEAIVGSLKEFLSPEDGAEPQTFDPAAAIQNALALTGRQLRRPGTVVEVDLAHELPAVRGVQARLEQVVVNLLLNASHHVPERGGRILLAAKSNDSGRLQLLIADNGPGVPMEDRERVFEPFYTTRAGRGGTGLGLSISSRIVLDLNGEISCDMDGPAETPSRFLVSLPAAD